MVGTDALAKIFDADPIYKNGADTAAILPTFLGNHDMGRIGTFLKGTDSVLERAELAHALMYLTRGQPVVYYGDEQGFVGDGNDKDSFGRPIYDPTPPTGSGGFDLTGLVALNLAPTPQLEITSAPAALPTDVDAKPDPRSATANASS